MAIDITRAASASASAYPILKLNEAKEVIPITKSSAFTLELTGGDYKTVILMNNASTASVNVVFGVGNGIQGVGASMTVAIGSSTTKAIVLDAGYFKNVSGSDKNAVNIIPSGSVAFSVVELPQ